MYQKKIDVIAGLYKFKAYKILIPFLLIAFWNNAQGQNSNPPIDSFLKARMKYYNIPGMQVAIIKDGKIVKLGAYGIANIPFKIPVTNNTLFPINSMTKCFTGVAIMKLTESGQLDLNQTVSHYLGKLPEAWQTITIKQLLSHTSGLPDIVNGDTGKMIAEGEDTLALNNVKTMPMRFSPGQKSEYNQTNYVLLGLIIEKLSKKPYSTFIREQQFIPAHLKLTDFGDSFDVISNMAETYSYNFHRNGLWKRSNHLTRVFEEFAMLTRPAAGINSTAEELAKWLVNLTQGKFINSESTELMWTPTRHNDGTPAPRGLGWSVLKRNEHIAVYGSGGMRAALYYYPQDRLGIVILTNLRGANPEKIIEQLAGLYIPELHPFTGIGLSPTLQLLHSQLLKTGYTNAEVTYKEFQQKDIQFKISEAAMNDWGYTLLDIGRVKEAIEIFNLNTKIYPDSGNTYDSLAEAYIASGNKSMALKNYRRSLEYSPENANAKEQIKKLERQIKKQ